MAPDGGRRAGGAGEGRLAHREGSVLVSGGLFLTAVRQHGWDPALPPDAMLFPGDQPRRTELLPRALAGHVMAQVESAAPPTGWRSTG
jgi:hypothetical protein